MTGLMIRMQVGRENRFELVQVLEDATRAGHLPCGCLERRLYEESGSPFTIMFIERWTDNNALDRYLSSNDFHALMGAVKVLGNLENVDLFEPEPIEFKR